MDCLCCQLDDQRKWYELEMREAAELEQFRAVEWICKEAKLVKERLEHEAEEECTPAPVEPRGPIGTEEVSHTMTGDNTALLAQQLQLIEKFYRAQTDGQSDTFKDWLEQFETVTNTFSWSDRVKQVGLTTWLKGPALDFYRTCLLEKRNTYENLKACLISRFMPVWLQAVQSCMFSEWRDC